MTKVDRLLGQMAGMAVTAAIVAATDWPIEISTGVGILAGALTVFVITNLILRDRV
jgi:hypothetical protein